MMSAAKLDSFKRMSRLTDAEESDFMKTTYSTVQLYIRELQAEQERTTGLMYMKRLEPFLISMQQFEQVVKVLEVFVNMTQVMAYVWVSCNPILSEL